MLQSGLDVHACVGILQARPLISLGWCNAPTSLDQLQSTSNKPTASHLPPRTQVFHALSTSSGGNPAATFDEVVARLARSKAAKGFPSAREALMVNGKFLLAQVCGKGVTFPRCARCALLAAPLHPRWLSPLAAVAVPCTLVQPPNT